MTITLGAVVSLNGSFATDGLAAKLGYELWAAKVNNEGGIPLLDRSQTPILDAAGEPVKLPVALTIRDDNSDPAQHRRQMEQQLTAPNIVDFVLGGHTSFGLDDAKNGSAVDRLVFLCCVGPPSVYTHNLENLFGIHTSSDKYTEQALRAGALSDDVSAVALVYNSGSTFAKSTCAAARKYVQTFMGRDPVLEVAYSAAPGEAVNATVFAQFVGDAARLGAEMVVGCTLGDDGVMLAQALETARFPSKATFITVAPATSGIVARAGVNASRYLLTAVQWHPSMGGASSDLYTDNFFGNASAYAQAFEAFALAQGTPVNASYLAAGPSAAAYALQLGISSAFYDCQLGAGAASARALLFGEGVIVCADGQNEGYKRVLTAVRNLRASSFFGPIAFDQNQRNVGREPSTVQILDNKQGGTTFPSFDYGSNLTLQLVLPSDAADADLVLPQPNRFRAPCPLGSSPDPTDEFATCVPCAPGSFNDGASAACERCDLQHYSEARGAAACSDCPANAATTERGSRSLSDCLCKPGYYFATAPGEDCKPCPTGGSCPGGLQRPYPTRGYWTDLTAAQAAGIYRCNPTSSCAGGPTSQCTANFGGPLCYQCSVGFFSVFGSCAKCQSTGVTVLILLLVLALWFLINFIVFTRVGILDVAITLFQLLSITGQMNVAWPLPLQRFFAVAKLFAFEIDIISPVCAAPGWGYKDSLLVQLLLPVGFAALYFGAHAARVLAAARRRRRRHAAKAAAAADDDQAERHALEASLDNSVAATLSVVSVSYVALTQYSLGAFQCTALGGRSVLVAAPSVDCASGDYRSIVVLGVVGTCVYVVGAPLLFGAVLYRLYRRKVLETRRQLGRFGWLYEAYRVRWCWFGLAELAHRGIYIACVIFIAEPAMQVLVAGLFTVLMAVALTAAKPYEQPWYNVIQVLQMVLVVFVGFSGLVFYSTLVSAATVDVLTVAVIVLISACCAIFAVSVPLEVVNVVRRARAEKAAARAARAAGRPPPGDAMFETFQERWMARLLVKGSDAGSPEDGAQALARLADAMEAHLSQNGDASHLSLQDPAVFWRRVLVAFPQVLDVMSITDESMHRNFVHTMELMFAEGASRAVHTIVVPPQRAAVARWLATASPPEMEAFNRVVALMLGAADREEERSLHLGRRLTADGRPGTSPFTRQAGGQGAQASQDVEGAVGDGEPGCTDVLH